MFLIIVVIKHYSLRGMDGLVHVIEAFLGPSWEGNYAVRYVNDVIIITF